MVIADDQELARTGLRGMLESERWITVVGEATNGREAVALCRQEQPDLAILDVRMPEMDGLAAMRAIKHECPTTAVVIFTMHESLDYLLDALRAGAAGYLLKDASRQDLVDAVRRVLNGESILTDTQASLLFQHMAHHADSPAKPSPTALTPREREVLQLVAEGQTNREIAGVLAISPGTVKTHVERIIAKLGVSDRTQAAVHAIESGLLRHRF